MLCCLGLLAGCNAEPTYQNVSVITYNYTPWDLTSVRIIDASGAAGSGMIRSGGGEGSVSCCYTLKGTDFTVRWRGGDADLMRKHMFDGKFDDVLFAKETKVHFPYQEAPAGEGPLIVELHIYPDEHIELALSRQLLKYRIEDAEDMRGYMYLYFTVASDFENDAEISALLKDKSRKPGDFGRAVAALSKERIEQMKASGAPPGMRANKSTPKKQPLGTDDDNVDQAGAGGA